LRFDAFPIRVDSGKAESQSEHCKKNKTPSKQAHRLAVLPYVLANQTVGWNTAECRRKSSDGITKIRVAHAYIFRTADRSQVDPEWLGGKYRARESRYDVCTVPVEIASRIVPVQFSFSEYD
jgi:hypothetical protein